MVTDLKSTLKHTVKVIVSALETQILCCY